MSDVETSSAPANNSDDLFTKQQFHAVIVKDGDVQVLSDRVRSKLIKQLDSIGDYTLVNVFKGKFVKTRPRTTLELV